MAADRMGVIQHDPRVQRFQPRDLGCDGGMIGVEPPRPAPRDFGGVGAGIGVQRFAVEGRRRAQLGRCLPRVE